jgi:two-component system, OmpR family, phosphate regulon response regulator PhoB
MAYETGNDTGDDRVQVLLVEDDQEFAEMYRLKLQADGYEVSIAGDGEEGLRLAMANPPDLIFLDIRMPRLGGLEMLERLRRNESTESLPVVILSNYGEDELRKRGFDLGALEWLIKANVTPSEVSSRVNLWRQGTHRLSR